MAAPRSGCSPELRDFAVRVLVVIGILALAAACVAVVTFYPTVPLMVFAAVLVAILIDGVAAPLRRLTRLPRGPSAVAAAGLLVAVFVAIVVISGPRVVDESQRLLDKLPASIDAMESILEQTPWLRRLLPESPSDESMRQLAVAAARRLVSPLRGAFSTISIVVPGMLAVWVLAFFLAVQPNLYLHGALRLVPPARRGRARELLQDVTRALRWWLVGRLTAMAAVGLLTLAGLVLMGIPLAFVLSLVAALLSFVPYLGPVLSAVPAVLVALSIDLGTAWWVVALYTGVQVLENNVVTPLVQMRAVSLAPALLITSQLLMGVLFGMLGVLLATPIAVALIVVIQSVYIRGLLGESIELLGEHGHDASHDDAESADDFESLGLSCEHALPDQKQD